MGIGSLRRRVVLVALAAAAVVVVLVDLLLTLSVRNEFEREIDRAMAARVTVVGELDDGRPPQRLVSDLADRGIPAIVVTPEGHRLATDIGGGGLPPTPHQVQVVTLGDGSTAEVIVSRAGAEAAQRRLLVTGIAGSGFAIAVVLAVVVLVSDRVLRPLDEMVESAREIARGRPGVRLGSRGESSELDRLAAAFDEMLDAQQASLDAAQAARARSRQFLADAAHQLRTPVAGLRAASEALLQDPDTPDRDQLLANLAREAGRTGRLLEALLRVAELDRGVVHEPQEVDLVALVADEVDRQQPLAPSLELRLHGAAELPVLVEPGGIREAVANLLDNARRHARERVSVEVVVADADAVVRIADDGDGVPVGQEEQVFERFVSLDDRGGTGLGLAIARGAVRAQHGDLRWVGDAFELRLPRCRETGERAARSV
jgi:two-component system, OmpR family, sensor kinase